MEPANRRLHHQTSPRNRIQIGGSHEKFNPNRSRIGLCSRCQWQSPYHSFPRQEGSIATYSGLEGIQVATSNDIAEQIVVLKNRVNKEGSAWVNILSNLILLYNYYSTLRIIPSYENRRIILFMGLEQRIKNLIFQKTVTGYLNDGHGFHLDYEDSKYRQEEFVKILRDSMELYALTPDELQQFGQSQEYGEMRRHAWKRISEAHKNAKGDYGELILFIILKYFYGVEKFTTKVRLRSSTGEQIKGFDCAHFEIKNGDLILWLGEAKLREDFSSSLTSAIESIEALTQVHKLKGELSILSSEIELQKGSESRKKVEEAICQGKSVNNLTINIPVMLCYSLKDLSNYSTVDIAFEEFISSHFSDHFNKIKTKTINMGVKCNILFFLLPIHSVADLKTHLESIESANR